MKGLSLSRIALFCLTVATFHCSPAIADGVLSAGSEASCSEGFPVITGPGATVYGPNGSYMSPLPQEKKRSKEHQDRAVGSQGADSHEVKCVVKNYSWLPNNAYSAHTKTEPAKTGSDAGSKKDNISEVYPLD